MTKSSMTVNVYRPEQLLNELQATRTACLELNGIRYQLVSKSNYRRYQIMSASLNSCQRLIDCRTLKLFKICLGKKQYVHERGSLTHYAVGSISNDQRSFYKLHMLQTASQTLDKMQYFIKIKTHHTKNSVLEKHCEMCFNRL